MTKICCCFNNLSSYRETIYTAMDREFDIDWYIEDSDEGVKEFDAAKLKSVRHLHRVPLKGFYWVKGMLSLLRKDYDTYLMLGATRNLTLYVFLALKCLFFRKKRVLSWTHGYYGKESKLNIALLKRPMFKMFDGSFVYGNYARDLMIKDGHNPDTLWTIHNSLAYDEQLALRRQMQPSDIYKKHFGNDNPVMIFLGRLTPVKKLDQAIEALAKLRDKGEQYNFVFVGDGSERKSLENLAESLEVKEQVWFYGACYDERQNAELVYNADLCVAPGNIGLTAMHTMMFGCPAITHGDFKWQMPEFEAIHPHTTGCFFKRDDVTDLAEKISMWFTVNKGERDAVRQACYKEIDTQWNPYFQMEVLRKHLKGAGKTVTQIDKSDIGRE